MATRAQIYEVWHRVRPDAMRHFKTNPYYEALVSLGPPLMPSIKPEDFPEVAHYERICFTHEIEELAVMKASFDPATLIPYRVKCNGFILEMGHF